MTRIRKVVNGIFVAATSWPIVRSHNGLMSEEVAQKKRDILATFMPLDAIPTDGNPLGEYTPTDRHFWPLGLI